MCPYISLCDCGRVWISTGSEYCMQLIVWTLNAIYNRKEFSNSVSCSVSCWHLQTIFLGLPLENRVLLFACFWEIVNAETRVCSNNLNYFQNKTSRRYHNARKWNVKCKNKNVLEVLKSSKYISKSEIHFQEFKNARTFFRTHASNVVKTWCLFCE